MPDGTVPSISTMGENIRYTRQGRIGKIVIDRPEKKNAMTFAMLSDFTRIVGEVGQDPEVSVLIVTGVPGAFCAGTDLADLSSIPGEQRGLRGTAEETDKWWPLVRCPMPTICVIDGPAVGMGAEFTSQCDFRLATPRARFAWNFVHRGLVPDTGAGTWLLPRLIGLQNALRLTMTGDPIDADEAKSLGYVLDVVDSERVMSVAMDLAERIAHGSPYSQKMIKELTYAGSTSSVEEHMERHTRAMTACFRSEDHKEGVAAFLERRPAHFIGR